MEEQFQIEEMIYQDSHEVVFQARDVSSGHLVALRRFFLEDEALERLRGSGVEGEGLFAEGLAWLQTLEISGLRKVLGGGFDELDGTPYLVTEWVDGETLEHCAEEGALLEGEGVIFESQARQILVALPERTREAMALEAREVVLARAPDGSLVTSLTISPRRYFGLMGGMNFPKVDRQQALLGLKAKFSGEALDKGVPAQVATSAAGPQLTSASKGSSAGLLWGSLAALLAIAGGVAWLVVGRGEEPTLAEVHREVELAEKKVLSEAIAPASSESVDNEAPETVAPAPEGEVMSRETAEKAERAAKVAASATAAREELAAPKKREEPRPPAKSTAFVIPEEKREREIDADELFGTGPTPKELPKELAEVEAAEKVPQVVPAPSTNSWAPTAFLEVDSTFHFENLGELIPTLKGSQVLLEGVVSKVGKSGSDLHWYFYFKEKNGDSVRVVYRHAHDAQSLGFEDWEGFHGKTVRLKGEVVPFAGKYAVRLHNWLEIKVPNGPRTLQVVELAKVKSYLPASTEVSIEGTLIGFDKSGSAGYLLLQEDSSVRGRFQMTGPLGSSEEFRKSLVPMKGKKVRLRGLMQDDPASLVETAIELEKPGCVELVLE